MNIDPCGNQKQCVLRVGFTEPLGCKIKCLMNNWVNIHYRVSLISWDFVIAWRSNVESRELIYAVIKPSIGVL